MSMQAPTCPVCFTRMKRGKDIVLCPECGYKLCENSDSRPTIYNTEHVHTPDYTTNPTSGKRPALKSNSLDLVFKGTVLLILILRVIHTLLS